MDQESRRIQLQTIFENIPGVKAVYYQPPENVRMLYPCIRYERSNAKTAFANNYPYKFDMRYTVFIIDTNPDSKIVEEVAKLQMCTLDRVYVSDNLYHSVFTLYY